MEEDFTSRAVIWTKTKSLVSSNCVFYSEATYKNLFSSDLQFVGCFLYFPNTATIYHGKYIARNLSHITCFRECQMTLNWTSYIALAQRTMCLCDSDLEEFEKTEKVQDDRCRSKCKTSQIDTKYCGQQDTMAVHAGTCLNLLITIIIFSLRKTYFIIFLCW